MGKPSSIFSSHESSKELSGRIKSKDFFFRDGYQFDRDEAVCHFWSFSFCYIPMQFEIGSIEQSAPLGTTPISSN